MGPYFGNKTLVKGKKEMQVRDYIFPSLLCLATLALVLITIVNWSPKSKEILPTIGLTTPNTGIIIHLDHWNSPEDK